MVVPPPMAKPCTAATIGLSKAMKASIKRDCGLSPGPIGFLRKSSRSLPAQKESPAPCQSTTRVRSSWAASLKMSARVTYMPDVIAFFLVGRFNWTRRMLPARSVTISSIVCLLCCALFCLWNGAARAQAVDFGRVEPQLPEHLVVVLADVRGAPRRHLGNPMHLDRATDRRGELAAGAFERNDDLVQPQLRVVDYLLWSAHGAEGDVDAVEYLVPMRHRLCTEDLVENGGKLRHVCR